MRKNIIVAMATLAFLPAVSFAAAPTLSDVLDASGITVTGHASGSYSYDHQSGDAIPGVAIGSTNQFTFDQAELTVSKLPTEGFGASVDVFAGQDVAGGTYNYGSGRILPTGGFNTFTGKAEEFNLHQAYVQYATGGLTVIGGKFATLAGYEVASDPLNTNATRSILFAIQPFTLTGVRAGYKFSDLVTAYVGVNNSASTGATVDSNNQKSTELGLALAPLAGLTVNLTDYIGGESGAKTNLADLVAAYTLGNLSVALNGDYNTIHATGGAKTTISGVALYANYQLTTAFRAGIRGELVQVKTDDIPTPTKNKGNEVTLTGDYSAAKNFDLVSDIRYGTVKNDTVDTKDNETTFVVKAIYKF